MKIAVNKQQKKGINECKAFKPMSKIALASIRSAITKAVSKVSKDQVLVKGDPGYPTIIEFCAPISSGGAGNVKDNLVLLNKAINAFAKMDFLIFDQMPYEKRIGEIKAKNTKRLKGAYDFSILLDFYEKIFKANLVDILIFLPGWQSSTGASWEYFQGKKRGIKTLELRKNWVKLLDKGEIDIKKLTKKIGLGAL